jgi:hypothetical protein
MRSPGRKKEGTVGRSKIAWANAKWGQAENNRKAAKQRIGKRMFISKRQSKILLRCTMVKMVAGWLAVI